LVLKAFASGATALTGVEAIADGVQAFRRPQARNAAQTLAIMAAIGISMFLGITLLAQVLQIRVDAEIAASRSVLSQIGQTVFGRGLAFYLLQAFTAGILILAANTSFQDFPRLSSILARDRFMPSQFKNRAIGWSSRTVVFLAVTGSLVYVYHAELTHLIHLRGRVHRLHPVPIGDGASLDQGPRSGLETRRDHQRDRRDHPRGRAGHRYHLEVLRGRVDRDRRDPVHRGVLPWRASPLRTNGVRCFAVGWTWRGRSPPSRRIGSSCS
jgi:hypothetical protein